MRERKLLGSHCEWPVRRSDTQVSGALRRLSWAITISGILGGAPGVSSAARSTASGTAAKMSTTISEALIREPHDSASLLRRPDVTPSIRRTLSMYMASRTSP